MESKKRAVGFVTLDEYFKRSRKLKPLEARWPIPAGRLATVIFLTRKSGLWENVGGSRIDLDKTVFLDDIDIKGGKRILKRLAPKVAAIIASHMFE